MNESFCPNCAGAGVYRNSQGRVVPCPACRATGIKDVEDEKPPEPCLTCSGGGKVRGLSTVFPEKEIRCPDCGGTGRRQEERLNEAPAAIPPEGLSCCLNPKCQYYDLRAEEYCSAPVEFVSSDACRLEGDAR